MLDNGNRLINFMMGATSLDGSDRNNQRNPYHNSILDGGSAAPATILRLSFIPGGGSYRPRHTQHLLMENGEDEPREQQLVPPTNFGCVSSNCAGILE